MNKSMTNATTPAPKAWVTPTIKDLPPLVEITLQTGFGDAGRPPQRGFWV